MVMLHLKVAGLVEGGVTFHRVLGMAGCRQTLCPWSRNLRPWLRTFRWRRSAAGVTEGVLCLKSVLGCFGMKWVKVGLWGRQAAYARESAAACAAAAAAACAARLCSLCWWWWMTRGGRARGRELLKED